MIYQCPTCKSSERTVRHQVGGFIIGPKTYCSDTWHFTSGAERLLLTDGRNPKDVTTEWEFREFMRKLDAAFQVPINEIRAKFRIEAS